MTNEKTKKLQAKPPVVVVLGHVDHGKSSLLEAIRDDFKIIAKESGGITQHIGAYEITFQPKGEKILRQAQDDFVPAGHKITFIDTPGHAAFSSIRDRGAKVADIAIIVIDATEGIKEQTKEAIKFAKQAQVSIIVALNKIDKMEAMPEKVKQELSKQDILVESMGGKIPCVNISAKTGEGIDELLETINIVAEIENFETSFEGMASGTVIEAFMDSQRGPIATILVKEGILRQGDIIATPSARGKAKNLNDFKGKQIKEALPSQPCEILGFEKTPKVGEIFNVYESVEQSSTFVSASTSPVRDNAPNTESSDKKTLNVILRADALGSLEAIEKTIGELPRDKVIIKILKSRTGNIESSDILLTESSKAKIFGFKVKMDTPAKILCNQRKISPKIFDIIYELVEEVRKQMEKQLAPETKRINLGKLKITHLFKKSKAGQIIGGRVMDNTIENNRPVEVFRKEEIIGKGRIKSLQMEKKEATSVGKNRDAGVFFIGDITIEEGDILQFFKETKEKGAL